MKEVPRDITVVYDRVVDVLHVTLGEGAPYEGEGLPGGVELDYALSDGSPCGGKVIGFDRNGWTENGMLTELAQLLGHHLQVSPTELALEIAKATAPNYGPGGRRGPGA